MTQSPDKSDLIRLISASQGALMGYILSLCRNRDDTQDILQETNVVLWERIDQFKRGTNFKAWAFRIAYLQTLAHLKRQKRGQKLRFSSELVELLAVEAPPVLSDFEIRQAALRRCLEGLKADDAEILQGYYVERKSLAEIAAALHRSVGALKQVLLRLRRSLRSCIEHRLNGGLESG